MDEDSGPFPRSLALLCRICHDEDEESNMEIPCSCRGTLKFAHHKCVQRWCNEKGDLTCEICLQPFKPGYTVTPPLFYDDSLPMNMRGNWEVAERNLFNPEYVAFGATDHNFWDTELGDYVAVSSRSLLCCRVVAIIFLVLLFLRLTLPVATGEAGGRTITFFMSLMLSSIGVLLPIYIMVKVLTAIRYRRDEQEARNFAPIESNEENELPRVQPQPLLIHVP